MSILPLIGIVFVELNKIRVTRIERTTAELAGVDDEFKEETEKLQADEEHRTQWKNRQLADDSTPDKPTVLDEPNRAV